MLAIGAGIAWRLLRHPPITTALVGAGLFSLLRTSAAGRPHRSDAEYLDQAKRRLRQQASGVANDIGDQASNLAATATEKMQQWNAEIGEQASTLAARATEKVQQWNAETSARLQETSARIQETASGVMEAAKVRAAQLSDQTSDQLQAGAVRASDLNAQASLGQEGVTDKLLLGAAGVAVATALGIAYQRRASNPEPVD